MLISGPFGPKGSSGIWVFPLDGAAPRRLIDGGSSAALSPDDSQIAYLGGGDGIWLINTSGEGAHRIVAAPPGYWLDRLLAWSPDGRRVAYGKRKPDEFSLEIYDLDSGQASAILTDPKVRGFDWARDGRIIYARQEHPTEEHSANLWDLRVDSRTARVLGKPRRLTSLGAYLFDMLSTSASAVNLSFVRKRNRGSAYLGELEGRGTRLSAIHQLTFDEGVNWPTAWSPDSQLVLFNSDREGRLDVFQQDVKAYAPQAIVTGGKERRDARFSPDGRWLLYLTSAESHGHSQHPEGRLMRVAPGGGLPEPVLLVPLTFEPFGALSQVADADKSPGSMQMQQPRFRCPSVPQFHCVMSEKIQNQLVFTEFDPVQGRARELARIDAPLPDFWDLSPNGQWIALDWRWGDRRGIRLLSLAGQPSHDISIDGWGTLQSVAWAADGNAVFATASDAKDPTLLRISLNGEVKLLYKGPFHLGNPVPSPDGRHLAFGENTMESNVWVARNLQ